MYLFVFIFWPLVIHFVTCLITGIRTEKQNNKRLKQFIIVSALSSIFWAIVWTEYVYSGITTTMTRITDPLSPEFLQTFSVLTPIIFATGLLVSYAGIWVKFCYKTIIKNLK